MNENDNLRLSKTDVICWRVALGYYLDKNARMIDIAKKYGLTKPEVSKAVQELERRGLIEKRNAKEIALTPQGLTAAAEYSRKYDDAFEGILEMFDDSSKASNAAHLIAMTFSDDFFVTIEQHNIVRRIHNSLEGYTAYDGRQFCESVPDGEYTFDFTLLTVPFPNSSHFADGELPDVNRRFKERLSMANVAFAHPGRVVINNDSGFLRLHRITITQQSKKTHEMMSGKASLVAYYDDEKFVECPIVNDNVEVPLEHFWFCRMGDCMQGKLRMQFECTVNEMHMPLSEAEIVIII